MNHFTLVTSNENKLNEFKRFGLTDLAIEKGRDLDEVDADPLTVILYKSLEAGRNRIVEDTSLHVEGHEVGTNVRWLLENIPNLSGNKTTWEVLLGVNDGEYISVYQGILQGVLTDTYTEPVGFGFDCYFVPNGESLTLYDFEQIDRKDEFSARRIAIDALLNNLFIKKVKISDIPKWNGNMQKG